MITFGPAFATMDEATAFIMAGLYPHIKIGRWVVGWRTMRRRWIYRVPVKHLENRLTVAVKVERS